MHSTGHCPCSRPGQALALKTLLLSPGKGPLSHFIVPCECAVALRCCHLCVSRKGGALGPSGVAAGLFSAPPESSSSVTVGLETRLCVWDSEGEGRHAVCERFGESSRTRLKSRAQEGCGGGNPVDWWVLLFLFFS